MHSYPLKLFSAVLFIEVYKFVFVCFSLFDSYISIFPIDSNKKNLPNHKNHKNHIYISHWFKRKNTVSQTPLKTNMKNHRTNYPWIHGALPEVCDLLPSQLERSRSLAPLLLNLSVPAVQRPGAATKDVVRSSWWILVNGLSPLINQFDHK